MSANVIFPYDDRSVSGSTSAGLRFMSRGWNGGVSVTWMPWSRSSFSVKPSHSPFDKNALIRIHIILWPLGGLLYWYHPCHCKSCKDWLPILDRCNDFSTWWRHQLEIFSALLAICAGNSPVTGEFPAQSPVTRSFDVFFGLRLNKRFSEQWWVWWFQTPSRSLWRHCNDIPQFNL